MDRDYTGDELRKWFNQIKADRGNWDNLFEDIATYVLPSQRNFNVRISEGEDRMDTVYDGTAIYANERLAANLHFLATNPATPWFKLKFRDANLNTSQEAKQWLEECGKLFKDALNDSNFDSVIGEFWLALPAFGTAPISLEEMAPEYGPDDPAKFNGLNFQSTHLARTYGIPGPDGRLRDTFMVYELNARQAYERFGVDKLPPKVKEAYDKGDLGTKFGFVHVTYKRLHLKAQPAQESLPPDAREFASVHFEQESGEIVESGGYYEQHRFMPRWRKRSDDTYGYGIGEKVLPDVHTLNEAKALWFLAVEKIIDAPIFSEAGNLIGQVELGSRGITEVRSINGIKIWDQPPVGTSIAEMTFQELKTDIREPFFYDRLDLPVEGAGDMTAFEFGKRLQRAMQLFGPTLGRVYRECLNDLIQRGFSIMYRKGAFPPIPQSLIDYATQAGRPAHMDIEYDNPFARAQKSEVTDAIDMYLTDIYNMAKAQVELGIADTVGDLIDWDGAARLKAETSNMPPSLMLGKDKVRQNREARAQARQEAADAEAQRNEAETLQKASQADAGNLRRLAEAAR